MQHNDHNTPEPAQATPIRHQAFVPLVVITLFCWTLYRILFAFPVWFDEILGKAVFFGLPVWLYIVIAQSKVPLNGLSLSKLKPGLFLGLAIAGIYGCVGTLAVLLGYSSVQEAILFLTPTFWWQVMLAVSTGFWESMFFFGWILSIGEKRFSEQSEWQLLVSVATVFVVFHIPNILIRTVAHAFFPQLFLLFAFAIGQGLLFLRFRNIYALTISHAAWGLILLYYAIQL